MSTTQIRSRTSATFSRLFMVGFLVTAAPAATQELAAGRNLSELGQQAVARVEQGNLAGAIELLEQQAGSDASAQELLGALYLQAGRAEDARRALEPLVQSSKASATALLDAGRVEMALRNPRVAMEYLSRARRLDPEGPATRELGFLLGTIGEYREAYPLLVTWVQAHPQDGAASILAALAAVALERPDEAEALLEGLPEDDPRVRLLNGKLQMLRGNPSTALVYFESLGADAPPEMEADLMHSMADAYLQSNQGQKTIELVEGRVGDDIGLAIKLAEAFYQTGSVAAAASSLQRFVDPLLGSLEALPAELTEQAATMAQYYGRWQLELNKAEDAVAYLEVATRLTPDNGATWQDLSVALQAVGRGDEAQVAQQRAQQLGATAAEADVTGNAVQEAMRIARERPDEALTQLWQLGQAAPDDPRPPFFAAGLLLQTNRAGDALAAIDLALERAPEEPTVLHLAGVVYGTLGRKVDAEQMFRHALEADPEHLPTLNDYSVLLMEDQRLEEALVLLERARQLWPDDPKTQQNLERLRGLAGPGA